MRIIRFIVPALLVVAAMVSCGKDKKTPVKLENVRLSENQLQMTVGETKTLSYTLEPQNAGFENVQWSSSDDNVVTVSQQGVLEAIAEGNAVVSIDVDGLRSECAVSVAAGAVAVESVVIRPEALTLKVGESAQLEAEVLPKEAQAKLEWSSDDKTIAEVADGKVIAKAAGQTKIRVAASGKTAECTVTVEEKQTLPPAIGDFYYSDGTYSAKLDRSKTAIGLVFWVGDPTESDPALAKDHPECRNGLVVSLNSGGDAAWQLNEGAYGKTVSEWIRQNAPDYLVIESATDGSGEDYLNRKLGYNNTKAMELFNADKANEEWLLDAIVKTQEHRTNVPAPSGSSDWYLPSAKELSLMCSGEFAGNIWDISQKMVEIKELLNEKFKEIQSADLLDYGAYWSSTEQDAENAYFVTFVNGYVNTVFKHYAQYKVRFVLAF